MLRELQPHNAYGDTEDTSLITDERRRTRKRRITNEVSLTTGTEDSRQKDEHNGNNKQRSSDDDGQNQGDNNKRQRQGLRKIRKIVDLPTSYKSQDSCGRLMDENENSIDEDDYKIFCKIIPQWLRSFRPS